MHRRRGRDDTLRQRGRACRAAGWPRRAAVDGGRLPRHRDRLQPDPRRAARRGGRGDRGVPGGCSPPRLRAALRGHALRCAGGPRSSAARSRARATTSAAALRLAADPAALKAISAPAVVMLAAVRAEQGAAGEAGALVDDNRLGGELPEHQVMNLVLYFRSRVRLAAGRAGRSARGRARRRPPLRAPRHPPRGAAVAVAGRGAAPMTPGARRSRGGARARRALGHRSRAGSRCAGSASSPATPAGSPRRSSCWTAPRTGSSWRGRASTSAPRCAAAAAARRPASRCGSAWTWRHACGARPLAERARTELLATGARPRRLAIAGSDALTPSEQRVVDRWPRTG